MCIRTGILVAGVGEVVKVRNIMVLADKVNKTQENPGVVTGSISTETGGYRMDVAISTVLTMCLGCSLMCA